MAKHDNMNKMIRDKVKRNMVVSNDDHLTNAEFNQLIRQEKTLDQIRDSHKGKRRTQLTSTEMMAALAYMEERSCKWSEAKAHILDLAEQADNPIDMNTAIRNARGQTHEELDEEYKK